MSELIKWCTAHWDEVLAVIGGIVALATMIVKLTPTQKDDSVLASVIKFLAAFSIVNPDGSLVGKKADAKESK